MPATTRQRFLTLSLPLAVSLAASSSFPSHGQAISSPAYTAGRTAWEQKRWMDAIEKLRPLVDPTDRANYEVDFWLGTSLCRVPGRLGQGANILDWSLSFRSMPELARPAFALEKKQCVDTMASLAATLAAPISVPGSTHVAMATVRGPAKLFVQGGSEGNLALAPLRVVRPKTVAELESRLVPLKQRGAAMRMARDLAPGSRIYVSRYAAIASMSPQLTEEHLMVLGTRIDEFIEFMRVAYSLEPPPTYITIHLFPSIGELRAGAMRLHGMAANEATLGYSFSNDRSIVAMLTTTAAGTLLHEVSHMLVHESFGSVPQWLDEGVASLYETATASGGLYFGEPNWRSRVFAQLRPRHSQVTLRDVVIAPWFSDEPLTHRDLGERVYDQEQQAYLLAYARMFALYLQETRSLRKVFDAFRNRGTPEEYVPARERAVRLLEGAIGASIGDIEARFMTWAPTAFDPDKRFYAGTARAEAIRKELPAPEPVERQLPDASIQRQGTTP